MNIDFNKPINRALLVGPSALIVICSALYAAFFGNSNFLIYTYCISSLVLILSAIYLLYFDMKEDKKKYKQKH